jgi:hypothetical protein
MAEQGDPVAIAIIAADYLPDRSAAEGDGAGDSRQRTTKMQPALTPIQR